MLRMLWKQKSDKLVVYLPSGDYISIPCSCTVRNLENGWRKENEVVRTIPDGLPYSPQIFPVGAWNITGVRKIENDDPEFNYKEPYFISADACQEVSVWELDSRGNYLVETRRKVIDRAYGLHFSQSRTTLGCIKIEDRNDLLFLANIIMLEIKSGQSCLLEVI